MKEQFKLLKCKTTSVFGNSEYMSLFREKSEYNKRKKITKSRLSIIELN